jgi:hypothetical protein
MTIVFDHIGFRVSNVSGFKPHRHPRAARTDRASEGEGWAMIGMPSGGRLWIGAFGPQATGVLIRVAVTFVPKVPI